MPHFSYYTLLGINIGNFSPIVVDFQKHTTFVKSVNDGIVVDPGTEQSDVVNLILPL